jgi:hypothetical protein
MLKRKLVSLRSYAMLLVSAIGLSGCVTNTRDDSVYYGSSASYTPAEQRLRQQSKSFAETSGQACLSVGAAAAIAAYLLSDPRHRSRNAAIAGAAGCGIGMGVNYYVQNRRAQYANSEQRLQIMIQDIRADNARLAKLVGTSRQVVAEDRQRIAEVDAAYRSKEVSLAQARNELRAVADNRDHLRRTLQALKKKEQDWQRISQIERSSGSDTRGLDEEIQVLRQQISTLEEELSVIDEEISASPVAA